MTRASSARVPVSPACLRLVVTKRRVVRTRLESSRDETTPRRIRVASNARKMSPTRVSVAFRASGGSRAIAFEDRAKEYSVGTVVSSRLYMEWRSLRNHIQGLFTVGDPPFFVLLDAFGERILHGALATLVSTPDSSILDEYVKCSG